MNPTAKTLPADNARRTPQIIVDAAREVLGRIDLDPASDELANLTVKAAKIYTKTDDGLTKYWSGNVFLNPPGGHVKLDGFKYRQSRSALWWACLLHHYQSGNIYKAVFVAYNLEAFLNTQRWGTPCQAYPFCVPRERLSFPGSVPGNSESPPGASAIVYLGPEVEKFKAVFSKIGYVRV
jgi:ParB family transcriptional regulator, chromosome partitioning protein